MTKNARAHAALALLLLLAALCPAAATRAQERAEPGGRFDFYTRGPYRQQDSRSSQNAGRYSAADACTSA